MSPDYARTMMACRPLPRDPFDSRAFVRAVFVYVSRWEMFPRASRALVMVSGGQDSVALLHLLSTGALGPAGPRHVHALHVDHGLRGAASRRDRGLVEELCERLRVPLLVSPGRIDPGAGNRQERARDMRRAAAAEAATQIGAACVALGHTLDDQVETVLYRVGRYGGLASVAGMRARDATLVRPLLGRRRWETEAYCVSEGLLFARDAGNEDPAYARSAIRREVVPAWERILPGAVEALGRLAETAAEVDEVVADLCDVVAAFVGLEGVAPDLTAGSDGRYGTVSSRVGGLSAARLREVPGPLRRAFLHRWLRSAAAGTTRARVAAVEELSGRPGSGEVALGDGRWVRKEYDRLWVTDARLSIGARGERAQETGVPLPVPGTAVWKGLRLSASADGPVRAHDPRWEAYFDARALEGPLIVRGCRAGDRVRPLGSPGHRSVQDVLVDLRVPRSIRDRVPVVACGERILWVVGLVPSEGGRIRRDTEQVVRIALSLDGTIGERIQERKHDRGAR